MISVRVRPLLVFAAIASSCLAQNHSTPAGTSSDPYRDEPYVFEKLEKTVRMKPDGTGEQLTHVVLRVQSEGTARQFAVLSVSYASANETGSIDYIRVHKADGTTVETPTTDAIEMPSEVTREAPVYSDIREKNVPVRSLSVGDRLEYQLHTVRTKAEAPNESWGAEHFSTGAGVVLSQTITLEAPASMYVQVWSPNHPATPRSAATTTSVPSTRIDRTPRLGGGIECTLAALCSDLDAAAAALLTDCRPGAGVRPSFC